MPPAMQTAHVVVPAAPTTPPAVPTVAMLHEPAAIPEHVMLSFQSDLAAEMAAQAPIQFEDERKAMQAEILGLQQNDTGKTT